MLGHLETARGQRKSQNTVVAASDDSAALEEHNGVPVFVAPSETFAQLAVLASSRTSRHFKSSCAFEDMCGLSVQDPFESAIENSVEDAAEDVAEYVADIASARVVDFRGRRRTDCDMHFDS